MNTGIVTVRKDRACAICDNMINRGTVCKTVNRKGVGRKWVCLSCVERIDELESLSGGLGANFDDEGYAQVCLESKSEIQSELMDCYDKFGIKFSGENA